MILPAAPWRDRDGLEALTKVLGAAEGESRFVGGAVRDTLLGIDVPTGYYGAGYEECHKIATKASTPKAATMTTLAAVVAAWDATTGKHSWRNPTAWDARVLGALVEWGYQPSDVERILLGEEPPSSTGSDEPEDEATDAEASDSAA